MTSAQAPSIEEMTMRRVTMRLVPLLMLLYIVAYLDRVNIGFASLHMNADLGLSDTAFGFGAGIFFIGYFLAEVPSNLILYRVGARVWIARIMVSWGLVSAAMAFVQGPTSFYALRFLLGVAEAGFFPGVILYISLWFPARYRAGVLAMFMAATPLASAIGSPLSGALLLMEGLGGLHGWQWLFLIEALPALALGWVVWRWMTDRPVQADWLAPEQRAWLVEEMAQEAARLPRHDGNATLRALTDPRVWLLGLVYFGSSAGLYVLGIWTPRVLGQFGSGPLMTGALSAVPPVFAVLAMILWARRSDRTGERVWHAILPSLLAGAGLALAAFAAGPVSAVLALIIVNIGISAAKPPMWTLPTRFLTGAGAAAGIAAINSIGNLGGFAGPLLIGWVKDSTGSFSGGLLALAALVTFTALLLLPQTRSKPLPDPA